MHGPKQDELFGPAAGAPNSRPDEASELSPADQTAPPIAVRAAAFWIVPEVVPHVGDALGVHGTRCLRAPPAAEERGSHKDGAGRSAASIAQATLVYALRGARRERSAALRRPRDPRIRAAIEAMHSRYAEPLTVDDLARAAAMSRFHFSRLFRDEVGEAPYQHLLRLRVSRAAQMLQNGRTSVTEAALAVGFHDFSRFSRTFRRFVGRLPVEIARGSRPAVRRARATQP